MDDQPTTRPKVPPAGDRWKRWLVLAVVVTVPLVVVVFFRDEFSLAYLAEREAALKSFQRQHPLAVYGAAFLTYVFVTGLSIPGASFMSLLMGWYFGIWRAVILVSFASTAGATIAFLVSRYLFRDAVNDRFGERLERFNEALRREGAFYLFTLRLIAGVPFFVINLVMGLTPIRTATFWWVSQLGMLPGTFVYCYAGSSVPDLETLAQEGAQAIFSPPQLIQIFVAFALLGLFPLAVKKAIAAWKPAVRLENRESNGENR